MYDKTQPGSIQAMFGTIAPRYDRANALFSFGLHKWWNSRLLQEVGPASSLLDLCAGTGEISCGFLSKHPQAQALLVDFCPEMLSIARHKGTSFGTRMALLTADVQAIPLQKQNFAVATIAYGIRNVPDRIACFQEAYRLLQPQGRLLILELTRPRFFLLKALHHLYLRTCLPLLGRLAARNTDAYTYLEESVRNFVPPETWISELSQTGFHVYKKISLSGGIATLLGASKK